MAIKNWNNNAPSFGYDAWTGTANLGVNLARQKNAPLDISGVFNSKVDMLYYVTEGRFPAGGTGVADKVKDMTKYPYLGQIIALVNTDPEDVQVFYVKTAEYNADLTTTDDMFNHYFEAVGKATTGDDQSIVLDVETGALSLNDFGVKYYTKDDDGNYTATTGWKAGLTPVVMDVTVNGSSVKKLVWVEPDNSTVEGLNSSIAALSGRVKTIEDTSAKLGGDNEFSGKNTFKNPVTVAAPTEDSHAATKKYVDDEVSEKVAALGSVFELKDVLTEDEFSTAASKLNTEGNTYAAGDVVLVKIKDGTGRDINKEYVVVSETVEGTTTLRFELLGDPSGVTALTSRVSALETASGTYATKEELAAEAEAREAADTAEEDARKAADADLDARLDILEGYKITEVYATKAELTAEEDARKAADNGLDNRLKTVESTLGEGTTTTLISDVASLKNDNVTNKEDIANLKSNFTGNKANQASSADVAAKVAHTITVFGKSFDGSADVEVEKSDVVGIATTEVAGTVKSASGEGKVTVAEDGTMSIAKVAEAAKVTHKLTFGSKDFDGSAAAEIKLSDLGFSADDYATAAQGEVADSAVQKVTFAGTDKTGKNVAITAEEVKTAVGIADYAKTATMTTELAKKADKATTLTGYGITDAYTKTEIDGKFDDVDAELAKKLVAGDAMRFKGLVGSDQTLKDLPTTDVTNGDTYKVTTAGNYNTDKAAQVGDMFIAVVTSATEGQSSATIDWVLVPSGDDGNVYHDTLTANQLVLAKDGKTVQTLAAGTNGQVLKLVDGKPAWTNDQNISMTSSDGSIEIDDRDITVKKVNCNLLEQTAGDYLIFDCGSSTVNI